MVFCTERTDTEKIHLCLASDLLNAECDAQNPSPMDVDFNKYFSILREQQIVVPGHRMDFFDTRLGKKVQVTNQMTFRTFVIFQVAQKVEMITFTTEPIGKSAVSELDGGMLNFPSARPVSAPLINPTPSEPSLPVSGSSGKLFAHTVFRTERLGTDNILLCLASDLRSPDSDSINLTPTHVDFVSYCRLLRDAEVLDDDVCLNFTDVSGKSIPIINQMSFRAAVIYQYTGKADMITFTTASPSKITNPPTRAYGGSLITCSVDKPAVPSAQPSPARTRQDVPPVNPLSTTLSISLRGREPVEILDGVLSPKLIKQSPDSPGFAPGPSSRAAGPDFLTRKQIEANKTSPHTPGLTQHGDPSEIRRGMLRFERERQLNDSGNH